MEPRNLVSLDEGGLAFALTEHSEIALELGLELDQVHLEGLKTILVLFSERFHTTLQIGQLLSVLLFATRGLHSLFLLDLFLAGLLHQPEVILHRKHLELFQEFP